MTLSQSYQDELCLKLEAVGLTPGLNKRLVISLTHQVTAEGPESVVKRLKVLKQAAVNKIAGVPYELPWIAHTSRGPKGAWKPVWHWLESQRYRTKVRALNTMMVYASLVVPKQAGPTPTQERKFLGSVVLPDEEVTLRQQRLEKSLRSGFFSKGASLLKRKLDQSGWKPDTDKGSVDLIEYLATTKGTDSESVARSERVMNRFLGHPEFYSFHSFPQVQKALGEHGQDYFDMTHPWNGRHLDWKEVQPPTEPIGVIGYSQEPGAKLRAFASPNWVIQAAMQGLKVNLLDALSSCEWDCTHDQMKGVMGVQRWLRDGRKVFSVDLSDATNNFPLGLQLKLLSFLGLPQEDVRLLDLVSRSPYEVLWGEHPVVVWSVGQPLGAGPSFMSFALTHALVALTAELMVGVPYKESGSNFYILGDDIVISDEKVHDAYRTLLGELSCPVSESKCLQSTVAGEFAGKLITVDHIYHGFKYRDISDQSFMDVIRGLGPQAVKVLSARQKAYVDLVKELPEPMGLGWNPKGRPAELRYAEYLYVIEALEQVEPDTKVDRRARLVMQFMYQLRSHWIRYFPADRQVDSKIRKTRSDGGLPPNGQLRERIHSWIQNGDELGAPPIKVGDPRISPLEGWSRKMTKVILPIVARARERFRESGPVLGGSHTS